MDELLLVHKSIPKKSCWIINKVKDTGSVLVKLYLLLDLEKKFLSRSCV